MYDSKVSPSRREPNVKVLSLIIQEVEFNDLIVPQSEIGSVGAAKFDGALWRDGAVVEGCRYINPGHGTLCYD